MYTLPELTGVLQISTSLAVTDVRAWAIKQLTGRGQEISDCARLRLSVSAGVREWFASSFIRLSTKPLADIAPHDVDALGSNLLCDLIQFHEELRDRHAGIAASDPPFLDTGVCSTEQCAQGWEQFWRKGMRQCLFSDRPLTPAIFMAALTEVDDGTMCWVCFRRMFYISAVQLLVKWDQDITEETVNRLSCKYFHQGARYAM